MKLLIGVLFGFLMLNSCVYNELKKDLPVPDEREEDITYTNYVKNIIENNHCLECHVPGFNTDGTPAANRDYRTYPGVKQVVDEGHFKAHVIDGIAPTMPLGYPELPQDIKDKLTLWINQGAKE